MSVAVFIDVEPNEQISELKLYLKSKGAELPEDEKEEADLETNLAQVIDVCDCMWKEGTSDTDVESIFNSIISLVVVQPIHNSESLTSSLCERLAKAPPGDKRNVIRLRLLGNLFQSLPDSSGLRYVVYLAMVRLAGHSDLMQVLNPKLDDIKTWVAQWDIGTAKVQALYRVLHEAFLECKQSEKATKMMLELLGTYTEDNASQARDDAHRCIVTCLSDPSTLLLDHLLTLKPVKFLEGELIHDLLTIFVTGKLTQYNQFYQTHKDFITSIGLSHEQNLQKMRVLTFMQLSETKSEIDYERIEQEMQLSADDVEAFIIDVVRTKAVHAKIDQTSRRVLISSTTQRTFGKQQWQQLREQLDEWQGNLNQVLGSLQSVTSR